MQAKVQEIETSPMWGKYAFGAQFLTSNHFMKYPWSLVTIYNATSELPNTLPTCWLRAGSKLILDGYAEHAAHA